MVSRQSRAELRGNAQKGVETCAESDRVAARTKHSTETGAEPVLLNGGRGSRACQRSIEPRRDSPNLRVTGDPSAPDPRRAVVVQTATRSPMSSDHRGTCRTALVRRPLHAAYGRLTVVRELGTTARKRRVLVRCACGTEKVVAECDLHSGTVSSCGCLRRERAATLNRTHGENRTTLHRAWSAIWDRTQHKDGYLRRGITVHDAWRSYPVFRDYVLDHLGSRPAGVYSLDRINNDRGYEPGNIRWATAKTQARNRSCNTIITVDGLSLSIAEWAERSGISSAVICRRRARGWPDHLAVTKSARSYR